MKAHKDVSAEQGRATETNNKECHKGILGHFKTYFGRHRLGELLVTKGIVAPNDLKFALQQQKKRVYRWVKSS